MDTQTILGLIARHALTTIAGFLAAHGYLGSSTTEQFVGAGMLILGVGWSWWQKSGQAAVAARLDKLKSHVNAIPNPSSASPSTVAAKIDTAKAAAAALFLAVALATLMAPGVHAQVRKPQVTGDIVADTKANLGITKPGEAPVLTGDPVADLHSAIKRGGAKLIMHLKHQYALASSPGADGTMVDPIAAPCAKALVPIVDLVVNGPKATTVVAPDPMALTAEEQALSANTSEPEGSIVQIEKLRILRIAVQSQSLTLACGPLVQDEVKQAKNLMGGITSLITGAGVLAPIGL